jgi:hypothetical protein
MMFDLRSIDSSSSTLCKVVIEHYSVCREDRDVSSNIYDVRRSLAVDRRGKHIRMAVMRKLIKYPSSHKINI